MEKRWIKVLVLLLMTRVGSGLFAGGSQGQSQGTAQPGQKPSIQYSYYFSNISGEYAAKLIKDYNNRPESKAIIVGQYLPRAELMKRYTLGVVSNDLPELGMIDNPDSASFAAMGMWLDITDRVAKLKNPKFLEGPINSGQYKGSQYTLPLRSNCLALWSNDEMLKTAGITKIPETWDELLSVCDKLQKANPNVYPLAFAAIKNEESTFQLLPFLLSTGATLDSIDSPEAAKSLTFLKTLLDKHYVSPEVLNLSQWDMQKNFAAKNYAMMINGCWNIAPMAVDAPDLKYTITNIPRDKNFVSVLGGENIGMTKAAKGKEDVAWDFIEYLLSLEINVPYNVNLGTISPNVDAVQYVNDPVMTAYVKQMQYAVARGPHPKWPELSNAIQEAIQETLTGVKSPAQAGKDAAVKIKAINASVK